jgi:tRNA-2-methylthio-N6-dimethylallyladenosine synthase
MLKNKERFEKNTAKVYIQTFGCQMNEYDSERILYFLEKEGCVRTFDIEKSDIIVFNTCSVREKPVNKLYGHIGRLKKLKKLNPQLLICVGGCTAQNLKEKILKDLPYVDIVFGTHNISELPELIKRRRLTNNSVCLVRESGFDYDLEKVKRDIKFKAYVPIIIGCNNYCSYCIVPYVRGRERSILPTNIIECIKKLVAGGVLEITLLGQNVNSYGKDLHEPMSFSSLLDKVSHIEGLKRIRFMTSHPKDFSEEIINVIKKRENVANHIHLPLQSGSDKILGLMNRKYTAYEFLKIIDFARKELPDCLITTDIIVGFPGEDRNDFLETLNIMREVRFSRAFTFIYSPREGTKAYSMADNITIQEKKEWFRELVEVQNKISYEENKKLVGKKFGVLVEGKSKKDGDILTGRLGNSALVNFKGNEDLTGKILQVNITKAKSFYLLGDLCAT